MQETAKKQAKEQAIVDWMIGAYCRGRHGTPKGQPCPRCLALAAYARQRTQNCPRMESKTFCSACPSHCYSPARREEIRQVMRYAGPRMLLYRPLTALRHAVQTLKQRNKQRKNAHGNPV